MVVVMLMMLLEVLILVRIQGQLFRFLVWKVYLVARGRGGG